MYHVLKRVGDFVATAIKAAPLASKAWRKLAFSRALDRLTGETKSRLAFEERGSELSHVLDQKRFVEEVVQRCRSVTSSSEGIAGILMENAGLDAASYPRLFSICTEYVDGVFSILAETSGGIALERAVEETLRIQDVLEDMRDEVRGLVAHTSDSDLDRSEVLSRLEKRTKDLHVNSGSYHLEKITAELYPGLKTLIDDEAFTGEDERRTSLYGFLKDRWSRGTRSPVMIVGEGGIGKTVAMQRTALTLVEEGVFAVYLPMNSLARMASGDAGFIDRYIEGTVFKNESELYRLFKRASLNEVASGEIPEVVLFLDGWNELPLTACDGADLVDCLRRELSEDWMILPNVQVVLSGREMVSKSGHWWRSIEYLKVQHLSRDQIVEYLAAREIERPTDDSEMWQTLANPLMLTLFVNTAGQSDFFEQRLIEFIRDERASEQSAVIWNFLQCQIGKCAGQHPKMRASAVLAINFAAAVIGHHCERAGTFAIRRGEMADRLSAAKRQYIEFWSEGSFLKDAPRGAGETWDWDPDELISILCDVTFILHDEGCDSVAEYSFMHQKFRDFYAALYMRMGAAPYTRSESFACAPVWHSTKGSPEVLNMLAPLFSADALADLWTALKDERVWQPSDAAAFDLAPSNVLQLFLRKGMETSILDFSQLDLRKVSLQDVGLDACGTSFAGSLISENTFETNQTWNVEFLGACRCGGSSVFVGLSGLAESWDARSGEPLESWCLEGNRVTAAGFDPSGACVAWANDDCVVRVHGMVPSGVDPRCSFEHPCSFVPTSLAFDPSGKKIAVGGWEGEVAVLDRENDVWASLGAPLGSDEAIRNLVFVADRLAFVNDAGRIGIVHDGDCGRLAESASPDRNERIIDVAVDATNSEALLLTASGVYALDPCAGSVALRWSTDEHMDMLCLSADGRLVLSRCESHILLLHAASGETRASLPIPERLRSLGIEKAAISCCSSRLLCVHTNGFRTLWNIEPTTYDPKDGPLRTAIGDYNGMSELVALSSSSVACVMNEKFVLRWDVEENRCDAARRVGDAGMLCLAVCDAEGVVAVSNDAGDIVFLDARDFHCRGSIETGLEGIDDISFHPEGDYLACMGMEGEVAFLVPPWKGGFDSERVFKLEEDEAFSCYAMVHVSNGLLVTAEKPGLIAMRRIKVRVDGVKVEFVDSYEAHDDDAVSLCSARNVPVAFSSCSNGTVRWWDLSGASKVVSDCDSLDDSFASVAICVEPEALAFGIACSDDGGTVVFELLQCDGEDGETGLCVSDIDADKPDDSELIVYGVDESRISDIAFLHDAHTAVMSASSGDALVFDSTDRTCTGWFSVVPGIPLVDAVFDGAYIESEGLRELLRMSGAKVDRALVVELGDESSML